MVQYTKWQAILDFCQFCEFFFALVPQSFVLLSPMNLVISLLPVFLVVGYDAKNLISSMKVALITSKNHLM